MPMTPVSPWLALGILIVAAPIVPGVATRTKAVFAGRRGPPVWQLYVDLRKLAHRGVVYSTSTTWIFRFAPVVLVATTLGAAALLPLDGASALIRFGGDAVAFAYLFALGRFTLVLAAFDTGSSFEGMGASREVTFATLVEPGLFVALTAVGIVSHSFSLSVMLGGHAIAGAATAPAMLMVAASIFALTLAECSRVPVDDPATHLELTMVHEVMTLDHSGPDLAMILYANALKLAVFGSLVFAVALPARGSAGWLTPVALLGSCVATGIAVGIVESVMARLRLPRVPLYIAAGGAMGLFGLILLLR